MARWKNEDAFDDLIRMHVERFGVPVWVVKTTLAQESGFDPKSFRPEPAIRDASRGLGQVLYRTAQDLGYKGIAGDDATRTGGLYEPAVNIHLTVKLLAQLRARYPQEPWDAIYAAYNSGAVRRDSQGRYTNSRGNTLVQHHVDLWNEKSAYFRGREGRGPLSGCPLCRGQQPPPRDAAGPSSSSS